MSEQAIRKHLASGELTQTGLEYSCKICQQALGQQPLQHIKGTPHKNKVFSLVMQNPSRYPSLYSGLPSVLTKAHKKGTIRVSGANLECVPCGKSLTGEAPAIDHLNSQKHLKLALNFTAPPAVQTSPRVFDNANVLPPEVQSALRDGTIEVFEEYGVQKFRCKYCKTATMTGDVPLRQHLAGNQHKKNVKEAAVTALQQPSRQGISGQFQDPFPSHSRYPSLPSQNPFSIAPPPGHVVTSTSPDNFAPKQFRVDTCVRYHRPPDAYRLTTSPKGLVVIFNYTFKNTLNPRTGSEVDEVNLKLVFQQMNYEVITHRDCSGRKTLRHFEEAIQEASSYSAFLAFFLSHGNRPDAFTCSDNSEISVHDLSMRLIDSEAPWLAERPKILFFNYCRGAIEQTNIRSDSGYSSTASEAPRDLAVVQATLPQFKARRHEINGTLFVESLCEILEECACQYNLFKIVHSTSKLMQKKGGTTANVTPLDFCEFFFL